MKPPPTHTGEIEKMEQLRTHLGSVLKELRNERGFSTIEVGRYLDTTGDAIHRLEMGSNLPSLERLCLIAEIFAVDVSWIIKQAEDAARPF